MALTKTTVDRTDPGPGQKFIVYTDGSSQRAQGVVNIGDDGLHSGIAGNPIIVEQEAVTFSRYSTPEAAGDGEDSAADIGTGPCTLRHLRCLLKPGTTSHRWLMLFDSLTVPGDNADPDWRIFVPAASEASETFLPDEMAFATGLSIALSSTIDDLTVTATAEAFFQAITVG